MGLIFGGSACIYHGCNTPNLWGGPSWRHTIAWQNTKRKKKANKRLRRLGQKEHHSERYQSLWMVDASIRVAVTVLQGHSRFEIDSFVSVADTDSWPRAGHQMPNYDAIMRGWKCAKRNAVGPLDVDRAVKVNYFITCHEIVRGHFWLDFHWIYVRSLPIK